MSKSCFRSGEVLNVFDIILVHWRILEVVSVKQMRRRRKAKVNGNELFLYVESVRMRIGFGVYP